jgi:hypothetical protein
MYRVNPLNRNVLIMPDEVAFHADLGEYDPKNILSAIIIAEERFIKKTVCKDLYEDFRNQKNIVVTAENKDALQTLVNAGNTGPQITLAVDDVVNAIEEVTNTWYKTLWNEYLWKICAECVVFISTPGRWMVSVPKGEIHNNPPSIAETRETSSGDLKDVRWKMDKILQDRIDPLLVAMQEWLCENKDEFEYFTCVDCPDDDCEDETYKNKKTGWVHNIYDED